MSDKEMLDFLFEYCSKYPETFNKVSNHLYYKFGMSRSKLALLITYFVEEAKTWQTGQH